MSRRRYLSTDISTDGKVNGELSDRAALLYSWAIPHFADDCRLTPKNAAEVQLAIVPGRKWTMEDVENVMNEIFAAQLWGRDDKGKIFTPAESFYKYQTYINAANRRETPEIAAQQRTTPGNTEQRRETPENTVSLSLSLSPSPSPKADTPSNDDGGDRFHFLRFWEIYPKKVGKGEAERVWNKIPFANGLFEHVLAAVEAQSRSAQWAKKAGALFRTPRLGSVRNVGMMSSS